MTKVKPVETQPQELPMTEELPYILGRWGGYTQWKCRYCPWDTLEGEQALIDHFTVTHNQPAENQHSSILLVADRFGNPINGG